MTEPGSDPVGDRTDGSALAGTPERTLSERTVSGIRWIGVARLFAEIVTFGGTVVLARFVAPSEFGRAAAALGLITLGTAFVSQMLGAPIVQRPELTREIVQTAVFLSIWAGALFTALTVLIAEIVVDPLLGSRTAYLVALGTPAIVASTIGAVARALLQRRLAFRTLGLIEISALFAGTVTAVSLATLAGLDGEALVLSFVAANAATALLSLLYTPWIRPRWGGRPPAGAILGFGASAGGSALLATGFRGVDYLVLASRMSPADVGFYWRAFVLGVEYQTKISVIMQRIAFPVFSRAPDVDEMRRLRLRVLATHAAILLPLLSTLAVVAPVLIPWLFGERWQPAVVPTQILSGAGVIAALIADTPAFMLALGRSRPLLAYNVISVVGLAVVAFVSAPYGLVTVAASVLGFYIFRLLLNNAWLLHRVGGIAFRDLWREVAPPLVACVPLAAVELGLIELFGRTGVPTLAVLTVTGSLGFVAYAIALRILFPGSWRLHRSLLVRVLGLRRTPRLGASTSTDPSRPVP